MRPRVVLMLAIAAVVVGSGMLVPAAYARLGASRSDAAPEPDPTASAVPLTPTASAVPPAPPPPSTLASAPVDIDLGKGNFLSWALLDRRTSGISGPENMTKTNSTESMIKVWIVSDYLRRLGDDDPPGWRLEQASTAIRDSNDNSAQSLYRASGGKSVIDRLISMCDLTETEPVVPPGENVVWWSYTRMSARDAVRLGQCIKSGRAAGPKWTDWVLDEMSEVRGSITDQHPHSGGGRWGIIDGLPAEMVEQGHVGIKNGWTPIYADGKWHVNCLAVADDWVLAVMMRYPIRKGLDYGAKVCASVARQLVTPRPGAARKVPRLRMPRRE